MVRIQEITYSDQPGELRKFWRSQDFESASAHPLLHWNAASQPCIYAVIWEFQKHNFFLVGHAVGLFHYSLVIVILQRYSAFAAGWACAKGIVRSFMGSISCITSITAIRLESLNIGPHNCLEEWFSFKGMNLLPLALCIFDVEFYAMIIDFLRSICNFLKLLRNRSMTAKWLQECFGDVTSAKELGSFFYHCYFLYIIKRWYHWLTLCCSSWEKACWSRQKSKYLCEETTSSPNKRNFWFSEKESGIFLFFSLNTDAFLHMPWEE